MCFYSYEGMGGPIKVFSVFSSLPVLISFSDVDCYYHMLYLHVPTLVCWILNVGIVSYSGTSSYLLFTYTVFKWNICVKY